MTGRRRLARFGEEVAATFLIRRGAVIEGRNVRVGRGELDLVVRLGDRRIAVEVKTVGRGATAEDPMERLTFAKLDQVRLLADRMSPPPGDRVRPVRVDFIGVRVTEGGVTVNWRKAVA